MIQTSPSMRILVAVEPVDFRRYAVMEVMLSLRHLGKLHCRFGGPQEPTL